MIKRGAKRFHARLRAYSASACSILLLLAQPLVQPRLEVKVNDKKYCEGDAEVGTVQLKSVLAFTNQSNRPIILSRSANAIRKLLVARSLDAANEGHFDYDMRLTTIIADAPRIINKDRPGSGFVVLKKTETFQTAVLVPIPFKLSETKMRAIPAGEYFIQLVIQVWPENKQLGAELKERWKQWGDLQVEDVKSVPFAFRIDAKPHLLNCE